MALAAFLLSCNPLEPSSYQEQLFRVATVTYSNGKAGLLFDCFNTQPAITNFKDTADMIHFGVSNGDRVLASMIFDAVGSFDNNRTTLNEIRKLEPTLFEQSAPSDTMNYFYGFSQYCFVNVMYSYIWSAGHYVNVSPGYSIPSIDSKTDFHLYPLGVASDTLVLRLYADIPEAAFKMDTQSLLSCDISSLRNSVPDPAEHAYRDSLLQILDNLGKDTIFVRVTTPDTMRVKDASKVGGYLKMEGDIPMTVAIPFDF